MRLFGRHCCDEADLKTASARFEKESTEKDSMEVVDMIQRAAVAISEKEVGGGAFMMQINTAAIVGIFETMRCYV